MPIDVSKFRHCVDNFSAGAIGNCLDKWKSITSDRWILNLVKGYRIEFKNDPYQDFRPKPLRLDRNSQKLLDNALHEFLKVGIIECCNVDEEGFYSTLFPIAKKDKNAGARVIFDLSDLNFFIDTEHFKMDTVKHAIELVTPGCYFASIDFKNAYYCVLVRKEDRIFLRFMWNGRAYQFVVLAQGLSTAPHVYTKLLKPVFATLRSKGFTVLGYIDDTIFVENSAELIELSLQTATSLFDSLGLTISVKKSVMVPVQRIEYLGFFIDSVNMSVELTQPKKQKIHKLAARICRLSRFTIRELSQLIGNAVAAEHGVPMAPYYYKRLEVERNRCLIESHGEYDVVIDNNSIIREDASWWRDHIMEIKKRHCPPSCRDCFIL